MTLKPMFFALLTLGVSYNLQAADRTPKAPPPVLLNIVPSMPGFASSYTYFTANGKYMVKIDENENTVTVQDITDPKNPVLISINQYRGQQDKIKKEEKEEEE